MPRKSTLIAFATLLALCSCSFMDDKSRFISAAMAPDGKRGVFVFKRELYARDLFAPLRLGFLSGNPRLLKNENIIGIYDLSTKKARTLYRRANDSNDFYLREIRGSTALLSAGESDLYLFNLNSMEMISLPVRKEMFMRGRDLGHMYLVDERGTLILVNRALQDRDDKTATEEIWLRRPSGEFTRISEVPPQSEGYYGFKDNEIHFYSSKRSAYLIYNFSRHEYRPGNPRLIPREPNSVIGFQVDERGAALPKVSRKVGDRWHEQEVKINTNAL